jgi:hypothetical protein
MPVIRLSHNEHYELTEAFNSYLEWIDEEIEKESNKHSMYLAVNLTWAEGAKWARDRMLPDNGITELVKACEELDDNLTTQKMNPHSILQSKRESIEAELRQKITELRNKLKL